MCTPLGVDLPLKGAQGKGIKISFIRRWYYPFSLHSPLVWALISLEEHKVLEKPWFYGPFPRKGSFFL